MRLILVLILTVLAGLSHADEVQWLPTASATMIDDAKLGYMYDYNMGMSLATKDGKWTYDVGVDTSITPNEYIFRHGATSEKTYNNLVNGMLFMYLMPVLRDTLSRSSEIYDGLITKATKGKSIVLNPHLSQVIRNVNPHTYFLNMRDNPEKRVVFISKDHRLFGGAKKNYWANECERKYGLRLYEFHLGYAGSNQMVIRNVNITNTVTTHTIIALVAHEDRQRVALYQRGINDFLQKLCVEDYNKHPEYNHMRQLNGWRPGKPIHTTHRTNGRRWSRNDPRWDEYLRNLPPPPPSRRQGASRPNVRYVDPRTIRALQSMAR